MPRRTASSFVYFCSFISIVLQNQFNAFCFFKHHNNINYLFSQEIKSTANDIDYSKGDGRIQNEQFLEWEREEEELWNKDTQTKRKKIIRDEFDSNSDGLPSYMLDLIDEFGSFGEEIDVIFALF